MAKDNRNLSASFVDNKGKLPYPLQGSYRIVRYFGKYTSPEAHRINLFCNGLEIETTPGNDARSVFDGDVINSHFSGYDQTVIIEHGVYHTVYTNLESVYVKKGDKVKTGQAIGKIAVDEQRGHTAILNFGIRKNGVKQDPFPWLRKN
jgi:septal ring factor EnvC (AmiA/AmiB activator)